MNKTKTNRIRKDIRSLSKKEMKDFRDGLEILRKEGIIDELAILHEQVTEYAHNNYRFLAWHRMLLLYFEDLLRMFTNKDITVPYWDWTTHEYDDTFDFGCFEVNYPQKHCIKRNKNPDNNYTRAQINRLLKRNKNFEDILELVPHALVHLNVGGKDGDMTQMYSTNDPIFWLHHSMVDYIWDLKQNKMLLGDKYKKTKSKNKYLFYDGDINEILFPFNKKVSEVLDNRKCKVKYVPYDLMKIQMYKKPNKISDEYINIHGYNKRQVRYYEKVMNNEDTIWDRIKIWICT